MPASSRLAGIMNITIFLKKRPHNSLRTKLEIKISFRYVMDATKDALFRGEFEVVKQLVSTLNDGAGAKNNADKIIDLNGTKKTGGTGIKQLRENIAESKLSYEIMDDAAQAFLKSKIMDNIHKYFYLIVFAGYMREAAVPAKDLKVPRTFKAFMDENAWMREHIDTGKGNLQ